MPLIVITSPDQLALTPAGKPFAAATPSSLIPIAPVVAMVIFVKAVFTQSVGVAVTQGSATGTLKTALNGVGMTSIVITTTSVVIFVSGVEVVIGATSSGTFTGDAFAAYDFATNGETLTIVVDGSDVVIVLFSKSLILAFPNALIIESFLSYVNLSAFIFIFFFDNIADAFLAFNTEKFLL